MRFFPLLACLWLTGCVHSPEPTTTRRGETLIEKPADTASVHGEATVWYGSSVH